MSWATDEKVSTQQVTVELREIRSARAAIDLRNAIRSLASPSTVVLDFSRVPKVERVDLAALIPALATFRDHRFRSDGLQWPEQLFLQQFGVPPVGFHTTTAVHAVPAA